MRNIMIVAISILLLIGCAEQTAQDRAMQRGFVILEDHRPTEYEEKDNLQYLPITGQDDVPVMERKIVVKRLDSGMMKEGSVQGLYDVIKYCREQLYTAILQYNFFVSQVVRIHEQEDLKIDLPQIPEKADLRWYVPFVE